MYSAKINDQPTTFGTSGLLFRSNKLMYDRATNTLWNQFTGEPVIGPLAASGAKLEFFPSELTTWAEWLERHPETTIISDDTGVYAAASYVPEDNPAAIYYAYFNSESTMFPVTNQSDAVALKSMIVGIVIDGDAKAYSMATINAQRVVNDTVAGTSIVVVSAQASQAARAYARGEHAFALAPDSGAGLPTQLVDAVGAVWRVTEDALVSATGDTLPRLPTITSFWHGWFSFHPDTAVYQRSAP